MSPATLELAARSLISISRETKLHGRPFLIGWPTTRFGLPVLRRLGLVEVRKSKWAKGYKIANLTDEGYQLMAVIRAVTGVT